MLRRFHVLSIWVQDKKSKLDQNKKSIKILGGGGQKSVGLADFFSFFLSYLHGLYDLRNTYPYLHGHGFVSRYTYPSKPNLPTYPLTHTHTHTHVYARTRTRIIYSLGVPHLPTPPTLLIISLSLSLRLTPLPSTQYIKPTYIFFYPLTH